MHHWFISCPNIWLVPIIKCKEVTYFSKLLNIWASRGKFLSGNMISEVIGLSLVLGMGRLKTVDSGNSIENLNTLSDHSTYFEVPVMTSFSPANYHWIQPKRFPHKSSNNVSLMVFPFSHCSRTEREELCEKQNEDTL